MSNRTRRTLSLLLVSPLLLAACNTVAGSAQGPANFFPSPTASGASIDTVLSPTPVVIGAVPMTTSSPGEIPEGSAPPAQNSTACTPDSVYLADVTIPDGTEVAVGSAFVKTWRFQNTGACEWGPGYSLIFLWGESMGTSTPIPLPATPVGATIDISANMVAPEQPGVYVGAWRMQAPDGGLFGIDVYVQITVSYSVPPVTATPLSSDQPSQPNNTNCVDNVEFVTDITVPDDTPMQPGQLFTKTWRLRNSGTCQWVSGYTLRFVGGAAMATANAVAVSATPAGQTVDISVPMVAPVQAGSYTSLWRMANAQGQLFGFEAYIRIRVDNSGGAPPGGGPTTGYSLAPYLSGVSARAREIYLAGQQMGNRVNVFSKVGDSLTDEYWFLYPIGEGRTLYGSYSNLESVVSFYLSGTARTGNSFNNESVAAAGGWDSFDPLDPANVIGYDFCTGLSPLECELRTVKPAVVIIMIGSNDGEWNVDNGSYGANLRRMVQLSIDLGVVPVLGTVPWNTYRGHPTTFNEVIKAVAVEYDIPLIDYYTALERLPNHGVRDDNVHNSYPPDGNSANFTSEALGLYGYNVRNLLTVQMLDALWHLVLY